MARVLNFEFLVTMKVITVGLRGSRARGAGESRGLDVASILSSNFLHSLGHIPTIGTSTNTSL